jgi:hypothetical protein
MLYRGFPSKLHHEVPHWVETGDHRLRDDEHGEQLSAKMNYIRHNPVAAGLCIRTEDWPWIIERSAGGGSSSPLSASRTDSSCGELDVRDVGEAALITIAPESVRGRSTSLRT